MKTEYAKILLTQADPESMKCLVCGGVYYFQWLMPWLFLGNYAEGPVCFECLSRDQYLSNHIKGWGYDLIIRPHEDDIESQLLVCKILDELGIEVKAEERGLPF